jgi:PDZ domain-containing protein
VSRRVRTLVVGGVLFIVLAVVAFTLPVPYVILGPGPTINTLGSYGSQQVITIAGKTPNKTTGHLNLTTVSISTGRISVFQALEGWLAGDQVVVPRETIYPPGTSQQQVAQQDSEDFSNSQDNAEGAAFCALRYPSYFGVLAVGTDMKPAGALKIGDKLNTLDGRPIDTSARLQKVLPTLKPGAAATVGIVRNGVSATVHMTLLPPATGKTGARLGIVVATTCFAPKFSVKIGLNDEIGGPSAGMMFALGIIQELGSTDLTGGRFIAGTGTIDLDGSVGPIGGIQLKMIAARRAGATLFLAPAGNCADVRGNIPRGLTVAKVSTLNGALTALEQTKSGQTVTGC